MMEVVELIQTIGFPIACVIGMGWFCVKMMTAYREDMKESQQTHKEETAALTQAISNNTTALNKISEQNELIIKMITGGKND